MNKKTREQKMLQLSQLSIARKNLDLGRVKIDALRPDQIVHFIIGIEEEDEPLLTLSITQRSFTYFFAGGLDAMIEEMGDGIETAAKELGGELN